MLRLLSCCFPATAPSRLNPENAFNFSVEEERYLAWLNKNQLTIDAIREKAGELLSNEATLRKEQNSLLQYVLYSRISKRHSTAASNAISILKKSGFAFEDLCLQNISIPYADLSYAILNRVDFTGAILTGVNFSWSSLNQVFFTRADLNQINLGVQPPLAHQLNVVQMAILKDKKRLVSLDMGRTLYIWDLISKHWIKKEITGEGVASPENSFLVVSRDERYILLLDVRLEKGGEEKTDFVVCLNIIDNHTSKNTTQKLTFEQSAFYIYLFTQTRDGDYLLIYGDNVGIWELITDSDGGNPQFNKKNPKIIDHEHEGFSYHCESNRLALCTRAGVAIYSVPELSLIEPIHQIPWRSFVPYHAGLEFTADGEDLIFGGKNEIHRWNIKKGQQELLFVEQEPTLADKSLTPLTITCFKLFRATSLLGYYVEWGIGKAKFCIRDISKPNEMLYQIDSVVKSPRRFNMFLLDDQLICFENSLIINIPLITIASQTREQQVTHVTDVRFTSDNEQLILLDKEAATQQFRVLSGKSSSKSRALTEHARDHQQFFEAEWPIWNESEDISARRYACTTSANADFLIGEYRENGIGHLSISEVETGIIVHQIQKNYLAFAVSKDGRYSVFFRKGELELWDIKEKKNVKTVLLPPFLAPTPLPQLAISEVIFPSGHVLIEQNGRVYLWQVVWQEPDLPCDLKAQFSINRFHSFQGTVKFSGDDLFYKIEGGEIVQYNLKQRTTKPIPVRGGFGLFGEFDISEDKKYLVGIDNACIILWDIQQNRRIDVSKDPISLTKVRFSPNGRFIAGWGDGKTYVWEIENSHLRLLWQKPQVIEIANIELEGCKNLSLQNARLLQHHLNRHQTEHQNLLV